MSLRALIDGDIILYRSCWVVQKTHYTHKATGEFFDGKAKVNAWLKAYKGVYDETDWDIVEEIEPLKEVKFQIDAWIRRILDAVKAEEYTVFLSPKTCFRNDIAKTAIYKDGRLPKPHHLKAAREYMLKQYRAVIGSNIEADDCMGIAQTTDTVICSNDKDMLMIPGRHYNFVKEEKHLIDIQKADDWFFTQLIMGDKTDNIIGLSGTKADPGFGVATATKLVESFAGFHTELVEEITALYKDKYGDEVGHEVMVEHAQLVWILRRGDKPGHEGWRKLLLLEKQQETPT